MSRYIARLILLLLATACDARRSVSDGKSVTLAASASVADCPTCPVCAPEPDTGSPVAQVPPLPPSPPSPPLAGINWYIHSSGDTGGPRGTFRGIWPGGGPIPVKAAGWHCSHTAPHLNKIKDPEDGSTFVTESVTIECTYGAARVRASAACEIRNGSHDSTRLVLGDDGMLTMWCDGEPRR